jgi:predicted DNA-binding protein (UPF0251 family)
MPKYKLNINDVKAIKYFHEQGMRSFELAKMFEISRATITRILNGERWRKKLTKIMS